MAKLRCRDEGNSKSTCFHLYSVLNGGVSVSAGIDCGWATPSMASHNVMLAAFLRSVKNKIMTLHNILVRKLTQHTRQKLCVGYCVGILRYTFSLFTVYFISSPARHDENYNKQIYYYHYCYCERESVYYYHCRCHWLTG